MATLFLLSGIKEVDDLRFKSEIILDEVKRLEERMRRVRIELLDTQNYLSLITETVATLKSDECKIVSLLEYSKLTQEISKMRQLVLTAQKSISECNSMIRIRIDEINQIEEQIASLRQQYGKVLEFKIRG
jgi:predicted  nucleic acid-binding Zn-ribbon protein